MGKAIIFLEISKQNCQPDSEDIEMQTNWCFDKETMIKTFSIAWSFKEKSSVIKTAVNW